MVVKLLDRRILAHPMQKRANSRHPLSGADSRQVLAFGDSLADSRRESAVVLALTCHAFSVDRNHSCHPMFYRRGPALGCPMPRTRASRRPRSPAARVHPSSQAFAGFLPSEAVAMGDALAALERADAKRRQAEAGREHGRGQKIASGNLPEAIAEANTGDTRDKVAAALGMSGRSLLLGSFIPNGELSVRNTFGDLTLADSHRLSDFFLAGSSKSVAWLAAALADSARLPISPKSFCASSTVFRGKPTASAISSWVRQDSHRSKIFRSRAAFVSLSIRDSHSRIVRSLTERILARCFFFSSRSRSGVTW